MNTETTRRADPSGERPCSVATCTRPAVAVEARRTESMPARGFYPVCAEHLELPSAVAALLAGLAVHAPGKTGWAIYPNDFGYDLYPGDEGPQRDLTLGEALEAIGGDQVCRLAPAGRIEWPTRDKATQQRVLNGECREYPTEPPYQSAQDLQTIEGLLAEVKQLVSAGKLSAEQMRPTLIALENARHECALKSL